MSVRTFQENVSHELKSRLSGRRANAARRIPASLAAVRRSARAAAEELEQRRLLSVNFLDNYSTDTSANYTETTQTQPPTFVDSWKVNTATKTLDYSVSATGGYTSSILLLKPTVANTAGLSVFTTSGDVIKTGVYQPGLVLTGDLNSGGFVVQEDNAGALANHLVLLRETGAQLVADEGGTGNPPVLADLGDITNDEADTIHISATIDRSGTHPIIIVSATDTTTNTLIATNQFVSDPYDPASYGGTQIGWRARYSDTTTAFSVTNLSLQEGGLPAADHAPAVPSGLTAAHGNGTAINLSWTNNADNALGFTIERSTDGTNFTQIDAIPSVAKGATATYTDASAPFGATTTDYYRVRAYNGFNGRALSDPSNVASLTNLPPAAGPKETFYNFGFWAGAPVDVGFPGTINYTDATGAAGDPGKVQTGNNSVAFTGKINITTPGTYTFVSNTSNDGYLYVDGALVSSDPGDHMQEDANTSTTGGSVTPITLAAGQYDFVFEQTWARYVGQDANEGAALEWITPGNTTPVLVPSSAMTPTSDTPSVPGAPTVTAMTSNTVDMTFTANNNAVVHYQTQRSSDGGNTWSNLALLDPGSNGVSGGAPGTSVTMKAEDAAPLPGASYEYRVISVGADGSSAPGPASSSVTVPAYAVSATTPGVEAHYFNGDQWKTGTPKSLGQPDEFQVLNTNGGANGGAVDYAFGGDMSPDVTNFPDIPRIHPIAYSAVFTGKIKTDAAGMYTFVTNSDDDGYLYVNDVLVSSDPGGHAPEEAPNITPIALQANTAYNFVFLFNQQAGGSAYHVEWTEPGGGAETQVPLATATAGGFLQASDVPHQQTVDAQGTVTDTAAGSAAGGLALNATGGSVALTWTDQSFSELWFEVQRSTDGTNFSDIGTAGFNATTFTDPSASGHVYYRVRGVNWDGAGPFSAVADTVIGGGAQDTINGTSGNDAITLKQDADHAHIDWTLGTQTGQLPINDPNGLTINGNGGTDTVTLDNSNGDPTPNLLKLNQTGAGSEFVLIGLSQPSAGHKIDIESSTVQINYSGSSILPVVQSALKGGQIFSSTLAANPKFAIAETDSADPLNSGQPANTILLRPAIIGNATLSGKVGFGDFVQLARNYGKTNADWAMGDFDYDGKVDFVDLVALARNYNQSGPAATAALTPAVSADTGTLPKNRRPLSTRL